MWHLTRTKSKPPQSVILKFSCHCPFKPIHQGPLIIQYVASILLRYSYNKFEFLLPGVPRTPRNIPSIALFHHILYVSDYPFKSNKTSKQNLLQCCLCQSGWNQTALFNIQLGGFIIISLGGIYIVHTLYSTRVYKERLQCHIKLQGVHDKVDLIQ